MAVKKAGNGNLTFYFGITYLLSLPLLFLWLVIPTSFEWRVFYALYFSTSFTDVNYVRSPSDCDWGRAPLGDKGCHYKRTVDAIKGDNGLVNVYVYYTKEQE